MKKHLFSIDQLERGCWISEGEEIKKGVFNYLIRSQEQIDRILALNREIRCYRAYFELTSPVEFKSIIISNRNNYQLCSKYNFKERNNFITAYPRLEHEPGIGYKQSQLEKIPFK